MNTPVTAHAVQRRAPMKNVSRERMQAEMALLRSQVEALEASRQLLLTQKRKRKTLYARQPEVRDESGRRRAAEDENKRLRKVLSKHIHAIKSMMAAVQVDASWVGINPKPSLSSVLNDDNGYRFSVLLDGVDRIYRQTDRMIQFETGNKEHPQQFTSTLTSRSVEDRELLMLEGRRTTMVPYDLKNCHDAMWQAIKESTWSEYTKAFIHSSSADCVMARLISVHTMGGETVEMTTSVVIKRFVEDDLACVVWRAVSSLDGTALDRDLYIDESAWSVMKQVTDDDGKESVIRKFCSQWVPRSFSEYGDRAIAIHPETTAFTSLLLAVTLNDTTEINEVMENLLIEDCMADETLSGSQTL